MVDFSRNSQKSKPDLSLKPGYDPQLNIDMDIATAEFSYFYIHQIKSWAGWSVNQEEIDYIVDPPVYLNA